MTGYQGPAFGKKQHKSFSDPTKASSGYQPAYKDLQQETHQKMDQEIKKRQRREPGIGQNSNPQAYELPFFKNQPSKSTPTFQEARDRQQKGDQGASESLKPGRAFPADFEEMGGRRDYQPSLLQQQKKKKPKAFQVTELPKPYQDKKTSDRKLLRTLAKRLVKDKNSFVLFSEEEANKDVKS